MSVPCLLAIGNVREGVGGVGAEGAIQCPGVYSPNLTLNAPSYSLAVH